MFSQIDVKPRLLESRVIEDEKFLHLSDGFKRVFSNEREDKNIILPIAGYGGHRRGDRSQNFFGRPFRDISIQSKRLQRQLQMGNSPVAADLWTKRSWTFLLRPMPFVVWFQLSDKYSSNIIINASLSLPLTHHIPKNIETFEEIAQSVSFWQLLLFYKSYNLHI